VTAIGLDLEAKGDFVPLDGADLQDIVGQQSLVTGKRRVADRMRPPELAFGRKARLVAAVKAARTQCKGNRDDQQGAR
jgi:hypothetical protein